VLFDHPSGAAVRPAIVAISEHDTRASPRRLYRARGVAIQHFFLRDWRLDIARDTFTGVVRCSLHSRDKRTIYVPGAVGFRFPARQDTLAAWYRVDGGAAVRWQDRYTKLFETIVRFDGGGLDNPTAGTVWVPLGKVLAARAVVIRPDDRHRFRTFQMGAFAQILEAARGTGCNPEQAFAW